MIRNCTLTISLTGFPVCEEMHVQYNLSSAHIAPRPEDINESAYYHYDYDYTDSVSNLPLFELIPVVVIYGLTMLLGVLGNALVIFSIVRYRRMQNVTNLFLTSLSSADLLLVSLCVPIKVSSFIILYHVKGSHINFQLFLHVNQLNMNAIHYNIV